MRKQPTPIKPDRIRVVEHPFGWVPCRMLNNGTITSMSAGERQLYLLLALAADRRGISFYGDQRLLHTLGWNHENLAQARTALLGHNLLAFDGMTYQLLPLPPDGSPKLNTVSKQNQRTRLKAEMLTKNENTHKREKMPESVRETLRKLFGQEAF